MEPDVAIMNLDESQKAKVREWIGAGIQPAEIQQRLSKEFGLSLTYMEVRFLLNDLNLQPKDKEAPVDPLLKTVAAKPAGSKPGEPATDIPESGAKPGGISVTVDQVTRAGAMVSGRVTFSDGKSAEWYLDQMGRLGLAPQEKGYKPTQADLMDFQVALQNELAKLGI
jgi:hypothetical protein